MVGWLVPRNRRAKNLSHYHMYTRPYDPPARDGAVE